MRALVLAAVLLAAAGAVSAKDKVHTVTAGESAASVATKYYGEADLGDLLLRYNGKAGKMIHPGERLSIPFCDVYRARSGDTWSGLAKRFLGRAAAAPVVAELNGYAVGQPLRVDARIVLPVVFRHTLARGESLSSLAQRFYGDPRKAVVLKTFGKIDDVKRVAVGTPIEIPLIAFVKAEKKPVVVTASPPPSAKPAEPAVSARPDPAPSPEPVAPPPPVDERRFETALAAAERTFADGEYDRVRESLEGLRDRVASEGSEWDRREWGRLLAFTYVALDRDEDACAVYGSGSPTSGTTAFDPDLISPRIRTALSKCDEAKSSVERLDNSASPPQIPPHAGTRG